MVGLPLLVLPIIIGVATYAFMRHTHPSSPVVVVGQQHELNDQLQAMKSRMADIQAHMTRLDALGEHLAESNNLKSEEFDFRKKPMGGPLGTELSALSDRVQIELRLSELAKEMAQKESQLTALGSVLSEKRTEPSVFLSTMPVQGGTVSSPFGYRTDPFTGKAAFHSGIDFTGGEGSDIYAVAGGVITWAGERTGYGNLVEINHGNGLYTRYAHARSVAVKVGDTVSTGQLVAYMGSTGRSTGPHLHYEVVKDGSAVDPATFLAQLRR